LAAIVIGDHIPRASPATTTTDRYEQRHEQLSNVVDVGWVRRLRFAPRRRQTVPPR
jgi:hypothetical protein